MGAEVFHAEKRIDRRADTATVLDAFRNFANAPAVNILERV
jgi:hypothetical protein